MQSRPTWELPMAPALLAKQVRSVVGDRLDVLVLNAGISKAARIADYTVEDFDNLFATNVRGPFFIVQQLLPVLGEGSSIVGGLFPGGPCGRGQARFGKPFDPCLRVDQRSARNTRQELGRHSRAKWHTRKRCRARHHRHDMSNFTKTEAGRDIALGMQALKRIGKPEDVADVVAFMASDAARWITGASIPIDGGSKL